MFDRARSRLTLLFIAIFVIVLGVFSAVFYFALATVLQPTLDVDPDVPNLAAAQIAYAATIQRIGIALVVADIAVVGLVGIVAWLLATRTPPSDPGCLPAAAPVRGGRIARDADPARRGSGRPPRGRWSPTHRPRRCDRVSSRSSSRPIGWRG